MNIAAKMFTAALVGAALMMPQSGEAMKPKPKPNRNVKISQPTNVRDAAKKDRTHTSRKQMVAQAKAAHKRGKATLKTARRNLVAVTRSEARNRDLRVNAKSQMDSAKQAYRANRTQANWDRWNAAYQRYMPIRQQHESSLSTLNSQRNRVNQLEGFQQQALNAARTAQGYRPKAPRAGQPRFTDRPANFVRPVSSYDRVQAPQQIYGPGPVQRVDSAAVSARATGQFAQNAQQTLVRQFNQQQADRQAVVNNQLGTGQIRAGANNNIYNRPAIVQNAYTAANDAMFF